MSDNPIYDEALRCAMRHWLVFPLKEGTKEPATRRGFYDGTDELPVVERWWDYGARRSNVGVATGHMFDILDIDNLDRYVEWYGADKFRDLIAQSKRIVKTPRGGLHIWGAPTGRTVHQAPDIGADWRGFLGYGCTYGTTSDGTYKILKHVDGPFTPFPPDVFPEVTASTQLDLSLVSGDVLALVQDPRAGWQKGLAILADPELRLTVGAQISDPRFIAKTYRECWESVRNTHRGRNRNLFSQTFQATRFAKDPVGICYSLAEAIRGVYHADDPTGKKWGELSPLEIRKAIGSGVWTRYLRSAVRRAPATEGSAA